MKIISEKIIFKGALVVEQAEIKANHTLFTRERINRQDASAVLLLNTDINKVVLTKQFRYAISGKTDPILEIIAGKIEKDHQPEETAIRETEEEVGYKIKPSNLKLLLSCFPSPGYTSELFYIYFATVTNADKVSEGGGLKEENESIEVIEMPLDEFKTLLLNGGIRDAKTYIAGLYMMQGETLN